MSICDKVTEAIIASEPRSNRRMVKWLNCDFISRDFALAVIPQRPFSRQLERERGGEIKRTKKTKKEKEEEVKEEKEKDEEEKEEEEEEVKEEKEKEEKEEKEEGETFLSPPAPVPLPTPPPLYHARESTGEWLEKCRMDGLPWRERKNDERTTDGRRGVWRKGEKGGEGREETRCTHTECSLMGEESVPGKQAFFSIETMDQAHYNFYDRSFAAEEPCARVGVHVNPAARRESTLYKARYHCANRVYRTQNIEHRTRNSKHRTQNMVHDTRNIQHDTRIQNMEYRSQIKFTNHSMEPMKASLV
ncbi:hypothetical protein V1477_016249 [Vespula maculifrons]|uniref:Uncharacterized protein n=1 Tax=Vespula maculifrons TaxID=7453 RepID=A0ABD2BCG7_VESMC